MLHALIRIFGVVCVAVGVLHVALGLEADQLLGAGLDRTTLNNASLDSQNRFYGAQFMLVGVITWICANDLSRHATLFRLVMAVFLIGGLARLISFAIHGAPSPLIQVLVLSELFIPPVLLVWHSSWLRKHPAQEPFDR
jgi:hypothetical protein